MCKQYTQSQEAADSIIGWPLSTFSLLPSFPSFFPSFFLCPLSFHTFCHYRCFTFIFSISRPVFPRSSHFSKGPWSLLLENGTRNHSVDASTLVFKVSRGLGNFWLSVSLPLAFSFKMRFSGAFQLYRFNSVGLHLSPAESPYVASFFLLHNQDTVPVDSSIWPQHSLGFYLPIDFNIVTCAVIFSPSDSDLQPCASKVLRQALVMGITLPPTQRLFKDLNKLYQPPWKISKDLQV